MPAGTQGARRRGRNIKRPASWYFTWAVIDLIVISVFICFFFSLPLWRIKKIQVIGNNYVSSEKVLGIARIPLESNIFLFDSEEIKAKFSKFVQIKEVRIRHRLPSTIVIEVKERMPFAIAVIGDKPTLVDEEGYIIAKQSLGISIYRMDIAGLPVIRGINIKTVEEGRRLGLGDRTFMGSTIKLLSGFLDPGKIQIEIKGTDGIVMYIEDTLKVKVGEPSDIEKKIITLQGLLDSVKGKWPKVQYIDVSIPANPVIRFK